MKKTQQNGAESLSGPRARLLELSQERGVSLAALSDLLGRNSSYLQQFIRKGSPRKLEEQDRATLARFLGVGENELREAQENSYVKTPRRREEGQWVEVPRLDLGAAAGTGRVPGSEAAFDTFRFSRRWLEEQGAARVILERECTAENLWKEILEIMKDPVKRRSMGEKAKILGRPKAAEVLVDELERICR